MLIIVRSYFFPVLQNQFIVKCRLTKIAERRLYFRQHFNCLLIAVVVNPVVPRLQKMILVATQQFRCTKKWYPGLYVALTQF